MITGHDSIMTNKLSVLLAKLSGSLVGLANPNLCVV